MLVGFKTPNVQGSAIGASDDGREDSLFDASDTPRRTIDSYAKAEHGLCLVVRPPNFNVIGEVRIGESGIRSALNFIQDLGGRANLLDPLCFPVPARPNGWSVETRPSPDIPVRAVAPDGPADSLLLAPLDSACAYRSSSSPRLCGPRSSWTVRMSYPSSNRCVANECRKV